jgi:heat shock protein 90kDa beta
MPLQSLQSSLPVTRLGYQIGQLEHEYEKWQRERTSESRRAFDEMLSENAFVEFWGRLGKIGGDGVEGGVAADDLGEDEGEGGGGKVDMKVLAKHVDLKEMERVLKVSNKSRPVSWVCSYPSALQNDKRYLMFDHIPEQRERWLRVCDIFGRLALNVLKEKYSKDYMAQLSAPMLSVHLQNQVNWNPSYFASLIIK